MFNIHKSEYKGVKICEIDKFYLSFIVFHFFFFLLGDLSYIYIFTYVFIRVICDEGMENKNSVPGFNRNIPHEVVRVNFYLQIHRTIIMCRRLYIAMKFQIMLFMIY